MIDGRGSKDGEPNRQKAGRFLQTQLADGVIKLNCFQKLKSISGERG